MSDTLALAKKLIGIPSVAGNTDALSRVLSLAAQELKDFTIERFSHNGVVSALAYHGKKRPQRFGVLLNVHLDVIPAKDSQFIPRVKGKRLYGAGAMDMKANAACAIAVFKELAPKLPYPLGLQLTTDEESGGFDGTKYQIEKGVKANFVIATEPTNFDVVHKAKGIMRVRLVAKGRSAHGAYPWRGINAISLMNRGLAAVLEQFPVPKKEAWKTTVNVAIIRTDNTAHNKVPDACIAELDIRFIAEDAKRIIPTLKKALPKGVSIEVLINEPAMQTSTQDKHVRHLAATVRRVVKKSTKIRGANGASDARFFSCPGVEFGPIGGGIGSDEEWVDIPSLETYQNVLRLFLTRLV